LHGEVFNTSKKRFAAAKHALNTAFTVKRWFNENADLPPRIITNKTTITQ
jgi:hypothetical protein